MIVLSCRALIQISIIPLMRRLFGRILILQPFLRFSGQKIFVSEWGIVPFRQGGTFTRDWMDAWTPENPNASLPIVGAENTPAANNVRTASTFFLKDGSFLRLKNIQVGYSIPQSTLSKAGISGLRIYFAADNWSHSPVPWFRSRTWRFIKRWCNIRALCDSSRIKYSHLERASHSNLVVTKKIKDEK
jgi:hypothetical protein